ncbi:MAG: HDOD domain-containing protein [Chromatiales bacterium]|nr:HDOD domain-containing protein [Chromatiales bacterium]
MLSTQNRSAPAEVREIDLIQQIVQDSKQGKLKLPMLPVIAVRLHRAAEQLSKNADDFARLIEVDSGLAAKLVEVSNNPLYKGIEKVQSLKEAITRLGLDNTKNIVFIYSLRNAFDSRNATVRRRMVEVWTRSRKVAAISFVLSQRIPQMDPNRAILAGLVHEIGSLPVLQYLEGFPDFASDDRKVANLLERVSGPLGRFVLKHWKFDPELCELPVAIQNNLRDSGEAADYADLVLVARAHSRFGERDDPSENQLMLLEMPAFHKMPLNRQGPAESMRVLREAKTEIDRVMNLLK